MDNEVWKDVEKELPTTDTKHAGPYAVRVIAFNKYEDMECSDYPFACMFKFETGEFIQLEHVIGKSEWLPIVVSHWMELPDKPRYKE